MKKFIPFLIAFFLAVIFCKITYPSDTASKGNIKNQNEAIDILDIYFYLGMGGGANTFSALINPNEEENEKFSINGGFSSQASSTLAWKIIGMKVDFFISTLHNTKLTSNNNQNNIKGTGYFYIFDITGGFHFGRKKGVVDYHYLYTGFRVWNSVYNSSNFNFILREKGELQFQHGGYGWIVGYDFLKEFAVTLRLSLLLKIGVFIGSSPANRNAINQEKSKINSRVFSFTFGGSLGVGIKIYNIQIILQYYYQRINTVGENLTGAIGMDANFQIVLGYKL